MKNVNVLLAFLATALANAQGSLQFGSVMTQGDLSIVIVPFAPFLPPSLPGLATSPAPSEGLVVSLATSDALTTSFRVTATYKDSAGRVQTSSNTTARSTISAFTAVGLAISAHNLLSLSVEETKPIAYLQVARP